MRASVENVPAGRFSARIERRMQEHKNPTEMNPVGLLVLATSYSRTAYRRTTIGAAAFHFRVRNGNGWIHCARVTRVRNRTGGFAASAATQARRRTLETRKLSKNCRYSGIYIQVFISAGNSRRFNFYLSFVLRSLISSVCRSAIRGTG